MKQVDNKYKCIPFWSWNDELDEKRLTEQIEWMHNNGVGGFFMHARGGLKTEYLGKKWFSCVKACQNKAKELNMEAYAYDENGWPSGFAGGKLLEDIENHDMTIDFKIGEYDAKADISYDISGEKLVVAKQGNNCLNLYLKYSTSTADILNPDVVDKFIKLTHEQYKKNDTEKTLKGFFTDEPQYYRWGTPYTKMVAQYFEKEYNENIFDRLGLLFVEKEGYRDFRYKYWMAMQKLMLNNFAKKIYDWCSENGYKLTGHYVEEMTIGTQLMCCAGIMPFYEYEHIPGLDWLGRDINTEIPPKQLGSVSAQLGKEQSICEMFACAGWDVTPKELKHIAEYTYVSGINLTCQHLMPYSEHGQRKRDYPSHFSNVNPWIEKNFKEFNDYFSVLGEILSNSKEIVDVAVLHPIRSGYFDYKRYLESSGFGVRDIQLQFEDLTAKLSAKQIPHHFIDETLLEKYGNVKGDRFICGKCSYKYLILPTIYTMGLKTKELIEEFVKNGGKVLLYDKAPTYLEGKEFSYDFLKSNITLDEIKNNQVVQCDTNSNIRLVHRIDKEGREFIYIVNLGAETSVNLTLNGKNNFASYDIMADKYNAVTGELHFDEYQSYLLYLDKCEATLSNSLTTIQLNDEYQVVNAVDNYLTLDFIEYSKDGKNYSEPLHHMGIFNELLKSRYAGDLYLRYNFKIKDLPTHCELLIENTNIIDVSVNGKVVKKTGVSKVEKDLLCFDVKNEIVKGDNQVVVKINYYQSDYAYYAIFGENVTEGLKNCLAYDTDIEAIYVKGDFGVYGNFVDDKENNVVYGDNFYIAKQQKNITSLIQDGFPFFKGNINLKQKIKLDNTNVKLSFDNRFHLIDVKVNGKFVGTMMFSNKIDISKYAVLGDNDIELSLTVGNRNLLGPFHCINKGDCMFVGPATFERIGTWKNGKSSNFRDNYMFAKTII